MELQWNQINNIIGNNKKPSPRWGHSGCSLLDPFIFLFGGYSESKYYNDTWIFDWVNMEWKLIQTVNAPQPRSNCTIIYDSDRSRVLLFGGGSAANVRHNDVWIMNLNSLYQPLKKQSQSQKSIFESQQSCSIIKLQWQLIYQSPQNLGITNFYPFPRTYHVGTIIKNYLFIHGGEGYGSDLDDLWSFNLQTHQWRQINTTNTPKGRRFHSCVSIGTSIYIIGGCYDGYNCLNDIHKINLKQFLDIEIVKFDTLYTYSWQAINIVDKNNFIPRWGHMSCVIKNNIYIFGGRSYNDHNDILMLQLNSSKKSINPQISTQNIIKVQSSSHSLSGNSINSTNTLTNHNLDNKQIIKKNNNLDNTIKINKIRTTNTPKGRRRSCIWAIGSCLLLHGGFNGNYFDDLLFVNLHKSNRLIFEPMQENLQDYNNYQKLSQIRISNNNYDIHVSTLDSKIIHLSTLQIRNSFLSQQKMIAFIQALAQMDYIQAIKYIKIVQNGIVEDNKNIDKQFLLKYGIVYGQCILGVHQKRMLCSIIKQQTIITHNNPLKAFKVSIDQINRIFNNIQNSYQNALIIKLDIDSLSQIQSKKIGKNYFNVNKNNLMARSQYFKVLLGSISAYKGQDITFKIDKNNLSINQNIFQYKLLCIYLHYGHMVFPHNYSLIQLLHCYSIAEMYMIEGARRICLQQLIHKISTQQSKDSSIDIQDIVQFCLKTSQEQNIDKILQIAIAKIILQKAKNIKKKSRKNITNRMIDAVLSPFTKQDYTKLFRKQSKNQNFQQYQKNKRQNINNIEEPSLNSNKQNIQYLFANKENTQLPLLQSLKHSQSETSSKPTPKKAQVCDYNIQINGQEILINIFNKIKNKSHLSTKILSKTVDTILDLYKLQISYWQKSIQQ